MAKLHLAFATLLCGMSLTAASQDVIIEEFEGPSTLFQYDLRDLIRNGMPAGPSLVRQQADEEEEADTTKEALTYQERITNMPEYLHAFIDKYVEAGQAVLDGGTSWLSDPKEGEYESNAYFFLVNEETESVDFTFEQGSTSDAIKKAAQKAVQKKTAPKIDTLNSFLPYDKGVYKLADVSNYAENSRVYRERRAAVANLHDHLELPDVSVWLWRCICLFQGYPFTTSGRGNRAGTHFTYEVSQAGAGGGRHYQGEQVESFGNELWIVQNKEKREKSISRSSVDYALQIVIDRRNRGEEITGPKQLKIYGASYVYSIYNRFGLV